MLFAYCAVHTQILPALSHLIYSISIMSIQYHLLAIVCVGAGIGEPGGWPDMFGFSDLVKGEIWSVRRFWG